MATTKRQNDKRTSKLLSISVSNGNIFLPRHTCSLFLKDFVRQIQHFLLVIPAFVDFKQWLQVAYFIVHPPSFFYLIRASIFQSWKALDSFS